MIDGTVATVLGGIATAVISAVVTYLIARSKAKVDVQAALNIGFQSLVTELQEERGLLSKERVELVAMVREQDQEIMELRARVERLLTVTTNFHNFIVTAGLIPPQFHPEDVVVGSNSGPGRGGQTRA